MIRKIAYFLRVEDTYYIYTSPRCANRHDYAYSFCSKVIHQVCNFRLKPGEGLVKVEIDIRRVAP